MTETIVAQEEEDAVYVTAERFAEISGLSAWVIRKWARDGKIPSLKAKSYMIHLKDGLAALRKEGSDL